MLAANHADQLTVDQDDQLADPAYADWLAARQAEYDAGRDSEDAFQDEAELQWMVENGFDPFGGETREEFLDRFVGDCWQAHSGSQFAS